MGSVLSLRSGRTPLNIPLRAHTRQNSHLKVLLPEQREPPLELNGVQALDDVGTEERLLLEVGEVAPG